MRHVKLMRKSSIYGKTSLLNMGNISLKSPLYIEIILQKLYIYWLV